MPFLPETACVVGPERVYEVPDQFYAKHDGETSCHLAVAVEVAENVYPLEAHGDVDFNGGIGFRTIEYAGCRYGKAVADD